MKYAQVGGRCTRRFVARAYSPLTMATPQKSSSVTVYGADWCGDTSMTRNQLKKLGVPFVYVNVDKQPEGADWVREHNDGKQKLPTVDVDGKILSIPDEDELAAALKSAGISR